MIRMTMKTPKLHLSTSDTISSASVGICRDACGQLRYSESKWRMPRRLHRRREPTVLWTVRQPWAGGSRYLDPRNWPSPAGVFSSLQARLGSAGERKNWQAEKPLNIMSYLPAWSPRFCNTGSSLWFDHGRWSGDLIWAKPKAEPWCWAGGARPAEHRGIVVALWNLYLDFSPVFPSPHAWICTVSWSFQGNQPRPASAADLEGTRLGRRKEWNEVTAQRVTQSWGEQSYVALWLLMTVRLVYNLYQRIGHWKVLGIIFGVKCVHVLILVLCSKSVGWRWSCGSFALFYINHMHLLI